MLVSPQALPRLKVAITFTIATKMLKHPARSYVEPDERRHVLLWCDGVVKNVRSHVASQPINGKPKLKL